MFKTQIGKKQTLVNFPNFKFCNIFSNCVQLVLNFSFHTNFDRGCEQRHLGKENGKSPTRWKGGSLCIYSTQACVTAWSRASRQWHNCAAPSGWTLILYTVAVKQQAKPLLRPSLWDTASHNALVPPSVPAIRERRTSWTPSSIQQ